MFAKMKTVAVAALLVIVAGAIVINGVADSEASVSATGSVQVSYTGASGWTSKTVDAYDVYQAVAAAQSDLGYTITISEENEDWQKTEYGYSNPNVNYGVISKINNGTDFTIYVYNNETSTWAVAQSALGWYRPFADYAENVTFVGGIFAGTANVAISTDGSSPSSITTISLTPITETDNFRYAFTLKDNRNAIVVPTNTMVTIEDMDEYIDVALTENMLRGGVTIYGYGSDAYLALKDALPGVTGGDLTFELINAGDYSYYQYYSWMGTILGTGTIPITGQDEQGSYTQYIYWIQKDLPAGTESFYTMGFYSKLSGAYNDVSSFSLTYDITAKYYQQS